MQMAKYMKRCSTSLIIQLSSVQSLSRVWLFARHGLRNASLPCPSPAPRACSNSCPLSQWCHPTISSSAVPFSSCLLNLSQHQGLSQWVSGIRWSFSFSISPSNDYSGLISFRRDWLDLLAVLGTVKSLLQHHSSKASILWRSAILMVPTSHPCILLERTSLWLYEPLSAK